MNKISKGESFPFRRRVHFYIILDCVSWSELPITRNKKDKRQKRVFAFVFKLAATRETVS